MYRYSGLNYVEKSRVVNSVGSVFIDLMSLGSFLLLFATISIVWDFILVPSLMKILLVTWAVGSKRFTIKGISWDSCLI